MSVGVLDTGDALQGSSLLNPTSPLAFLEPRDARYVSLATYIAVGTLAVLIWDILQNLPAGYKLLFKYRIRLSTLVYVFSRMTSLCYVVWCSVYYTAPIGDCNHGQTGFAAFYPAAISASTLLFLFRIQLVYDGNPRVIVPFSLLWLAVVGGTVTAPLGLKGGAIGSTDYCMVSGAEVYVSASVIIPLVYDTAVFVAITYRLAASPYALTSTEGGFWKALAGNYLPGLSRLLLKDGQSYYAVTVISNLLAVIMILTTSLPVAYRTIFMAPNVALINIMACQTFRNVKFGVFQRQTFTTSNILSHSDVKTHRAGANASAILPVVFRHAGTDNGDCHTECTHGTSISRDHRGHSRTTVNIVVPHKAAGESNFAVSGSAVVVASGSAIELQKHSTEDEAASHMSLDSV